MLYYLRGPLKIGENVGMATMFLSTLTPKERRESLSPDDWWRNEAGKEVQSGAAYYSLGFEDDNLGSSPGWWAATVANYCPSRLEELPEFLSSKPCE